MSGVNRKPTVMKILEGTARKDRAVANEPQPKKLFIPPPAPASLNSYGLKHWESMVPEMSKIGLLTVADVDQFEAYCNELGAYWEAEEKRKAAVIDKKWEDVSRWFNYAQKHLKSARDLAIQFGLTPAARARVNVPGEEKKSFLDDL